MVMPIPVPAETDKPPMVLPEPGSTAPIPPPPPLAPEHRRVAWSLLVLRLVVAAIFLAHGSQKMFGLFGGAGLAATMQQMGPVLGVLVPVGEFFGAVGMIAGVLTRFSAAAQIVIMLGAIATVHGKNGFFVDHKGWEYNLAVIGLLLPILIAGPGPFTVLRALFQRDRFARFLE